MKYFIKEAINRLSIIILITTILVACKNNPNEPKPNNKLEINIENGANFASKIDEVEFYIDREDKDFLLCRVPFNNGKLSLIFPENISDAYLEPINGGGDQMPPTLNISDTTARICFVSYRFYKNNKEVDNFILNHMREGQTLPGDYSHFIYSNKPTVVSGSFTETNDSIVMNLQFKNGYNQTYTDVEPMSGVEGGELKHKITLSTSTDKAFKWTISEEK